MVLAIDPKTIAIGVFVGVYLLIILGLRELAVASLAGVAILVLIGAMFPDLTVITWEEAWHFVDFDVVALLIGVIIVARVLSHVGFFRWLGIHMANLVRCDPMKMMLLFMGISALLNSLIGATVVISLIMSVVVMEIMDVLDLDPRPLVLNIIFVVNITGMSTSISSIPTILMASALGLSFWDFLSVMWAPTLVATGVLLAMMFYTYRGSFLRARPRYTRMPIDPSEVITDKKLFAFCVAMFLAMVVGFIAGPNMGLSPGAVSLIVAATVLIVGGKKIGPVIREVDWETVLSITSLLMLVGALEKTGVIADLSHALARWLGGNRALGITVMLWLSALISAFIDNVPYTMTMISTLKAMGEAGLDVGPLWWALAAGTSLGGNGTIIASYANIVVVGEVSRRGYRIDPVSFAKAGLPLVLVSVAVVNLVLIAMFA